MWHWHAMTTFCRNNHVCFLFPQLPMKKEKKIKYMCLHVHILYFIVLFTTFNKGFWGRTKRIRVFYGIWKIWNEIKWKDRFGLWQPNDLLPTCNESTMKDLMVFINHHATKRSFCFLNFQHFLIFFKCWYMIIYKINYLNYMELN